MNGIALERIFVPVTCNQLCDQIPQFPGFCVYNILKLCQSNNSSNVAVNLTIMMLDIRDYSL